MTRYTQRAVRSNGAFSGEFRPGHLVWMPAGATWLNQAKPRPFVLATRCGPAGFGTVVYGSTQQAEKDAGAAWIRVPPVRKGVNRNGLRAETFFYPGTLLPIEHDDLPVHAGFLGKSLDELRAALRTALGIGQGSCLDSRAPAGSRRGRIVELSAALAQEIRAEHAVVLTEPRYSRQEHYHIILPFYPRIGGVAGDHKIFVPAGKWPMAIASEAGVVLPIPATHSVWYADDIVRETEYVLDDDTLARIDRALCRYFSLPDAAEEHER